MIVSKKHKSNRIYYPFVLKINFLLNFLNIPNNVYLSKDHKYNHTTIVPLRFINKIIRNTRV